MSVKRVDFNSFLIGKDNMFKYLQNNSKTDVKAGNSQNLTKQTPGAVTENNNTKKQNNKTGNWILGAGALVLLIAAGIAGRYGKLGKTIQRALGGIKKIDINEINSKLDRTIPEIPDEFLSFDTSIIHMYSDLSNLKAAELVKTDKGFTQSFKLPNGEIQYAELDKSEEYIKFIIKDADGNPKWRGSLDNDGELLSLSSIDPKLKTLVMFGKEKLVKVIKSITKQIDENSTVVYDSQGKLKWFSDIKNGVDREIRYSSPYEGTKQFPSSISYIDSNTGKNIKTEKLNEDSSVISEMYFDEFGDVAKLVEAGE